MTTALDGEEAYELAAMGGGLAMAVGAVVEVQEESVSRLIGPHRSLEASRSVGCHRS